jgi:hypothetical protein
MQGVQQEVDLSRGILKQVQDDYLIGILNTISLDIPRRGYLFVAKQHKNEFCAVGATPILKGSLYRAKELILMILQTGRS